VGFRFLSGSKGFGALFLLGFQRCYDVTHRRQIDYNNRVEKVTDISPFTRMERCRYSMIGLLTSDGPAARGAKLCACVEKQSLVGQGVMFDMREP